MRIQKHRRKTWLLLTLTAIGVITWFLWPVATPTIEFIAFRDTKYGRRPAFKIVNNSSAPFYYQAYRADEPLFLQANLTATGWDLPAPRSQATVFKLRELTQPNYRHFQSPSPDKLSSFAVAPHSEVEIIVDPMIALQWVGSDRTFKISIFFSRTPSAESFSGEPGRIGKAMNWLRVKMGRKPKVKEPAWSEPVRDPQPPKTIELIPHKLMPSPPNFMSPPLPERIKGLAAM